MITRRSVLGGAAAGTALTLLTGRADAAPVRTKTLARRLVVPWGLAFLPNGDALVTTRESGNVHRVSRNGGRRKVGTITEADGRARGEGGLLGVAVSPTFASDQFVYLYLSTVSDNRVIRMRFSGGGLSDQTTLLSGIPANSNHNGGRLVFGPDHKLYVTTGDAGVGGLAQDPDSLAGKILRLNQDGSVPDDNPFGNAVWTLGHRNVQGLDWDRDGRMWATEFGEHTRDELNQVVKGHNYGWPEVEGGDGPGAFHDPFVTWSPTSVCSPSGLTITRGRAWVAALRGEALYSVQLFGRRRRRKVRYFHHKLGRIRTVERAPDGSLWLMTSNRDGRGRPRRGDDKIVRVAFR